MPWLASAFLLAAASGSFPQAPAAAPAPATADGGRIRADMSLLASDSMRGRGTGTADYRRAAKYVADRFREAGLRPPRRGRWFQPVPLIRRDVDAARSYLELSRGDDVRRLTLADFAVLRPGPRSSDIRAAVTFAGQGTRAVTAPIDDFARVSVSGTFAALASGTPDAMGVDERTYLTLRKVYAALDCGAAGTITLSPPGTTDDEWRADVTAQAEAGLLRWALRPERRGSDEHFWLGPRASRVFHELAGLPDADLAPRPLPISARAVIRGETATDSSPNVIGMLAGSDPVLRGQYVVVTAHLDHLGQGRAVAGDSIYNGAVDNASGVAGLIELARLFAASRDRPRRSLIFVALAAEEPGSLGSQHFVRHPPVPPGSMVAAINLDGLSVWDFSGIVPRGAEHSTLMETARLAAPKAGTQVVPDPLGARASLAGSDQYSFMTAGIPSLLLASARTASARELALDWVRRRYHTPSDDMSQPLDFAAAARFVDAAAALVREIGNAAEPPRWLEGSFYRRLATWRRPASASAGECRASGFPLSRE